VKTCIFCGSSKKKTNEHIFPAWLQRHLGIAGDKLNITFYSENPQMMRSLTYGKHLNGLVCEQCNGGWMSQLEAVTKPLLIELLDGQVAKVLTNEEVHTLGLWVFKTALTLHRASPYPLVIPDQHYQLAFERKAPAHCLISIARLKTSLAQPSWIQDQNWTGAQLHFSGDELKDKLKQTYRIVFGFGHFAARIVYFPLDLRLFPLEDGVQFIHPRYQNAVILWPPSRSIADLWELNNGLVVSAPFHPSSLSLSELAEDVSENE
jgi:hypothetical protein